MARKTCGVSGWKFSCDFCEAILGSFSKAVMLTDWGAREYHVCRKCFKEWLNDEEPPKKEKASKNKGAELISGINT